MSRARTLACALAALALLNMLVALASAEITPPELLRRRYHVMIPSERSWMDWLAFWREPERARTERGVVECWRSPEGLTPTARSIVARNGRGDALESSQVCREGMLGCYECALFFADNVPPADDARNAYGGRARPVTVARRLATLVYEPVPQSPEGTSSVYASTLVPPGTAVLKLYAFEVAQSMRRRGVGKLMIDLLKNRAIAHSFELVHVNKRNSGNIPPTGRAVIITAVTDNDAPFMMHRGFRLLSVQPIDGDTDNECRLHDHDSRSIRLDRFEDFISRYRWLRFPADGYIQLTQDGPEYLLSELTARGTFWFVWDNAGNWNAVAPSMVDAFS